MLDPKVLEAFFEQYMPATKTVIEELWNSNRQELCIFLNECLASKIMPDWSLQHFYSMINHSKNASHIYTSPWDVL